MLCLTRLSVPAPLALVRTVIKRGLSAQFRVTRATICVIWHIFPGVWLCSALGMISTLQESFGYMIGDLCAKYLLLFVYSYHVG